MTTRIKPPISVIITTFNSSNFLRGTLDSILSQSFSDFELLIGDDGSEDDTCDIINSYKDSRIRLIRCPHNFINTENQLIKESCGKYIARIDHDDQMLPDRLKIQYRYLELHDEIDALGGGMLLFGNMSGITNPLSGRPITLGDMFKCNCIANPTAMIRRASIENAHLFYESEFIYADDYRFWCKMINSGLHIENLPIVLTAYRVSLKQASSVFSERQNESVKLVKSDLKKWILKKEQLIPISQYSNKRKTTNLLTLILPFYNEGEDVFNTVSSIRTNIEENVDIIVVNDFSCDDYPYRIALAKFNVKYIFNERHRGMQYSQDIGITACRTPFFLLIDSKMEFYGKVWFHDIICFLKEDDSQILCMQTRYNEKQLSIDNDIFSCGKYPVFEMTGQMPILAHNYTEKFLIKELRTISFLLSVGYATSIRYWRKIRGHRLTI